MLIGAEPKARRRVRRLKLQRKHVDEIARVLRAEEGGKLVALDLDIILFQVASAERIARSRSIIRLLELY